MHLRACPRRGRRRQQRRRPSRRWGQGDRAVAGRAGAAAAGGGGCGGGGDGRDCRLCRTVHGVEVLQVRLRQRLGREEASRDLWGGRRGQGTLLRVKKWEAGVGKMSDALEMGRKFNKEMYRQCAFAILAREPHGVYHVIRSHPDNFPRSLSSPSARPPNQSNQRTFVAFRKK